MDTDTQFVWWDDPSADGLESGLYQVESTDGHGMLTLVDRMGGKRGARIDEVREADGDFLVYSVSEAEADGYGVRGYWCVGSGWETLTHATRFSLAAAWLFDLPRSVGDDARLIMFARPEANARVSGGAALAAAG